MASYANADALLRSALGLCLLRCALQEAVQARAANAENLRRALPSRTVAIVNTAEVPTGELE